LKLLTITHCRTALLAILSGAAILHAAPEADVRSPLEVAFAPDGKTLAATDATHPAVVLIDPAKRSILRSIPLTGSPYGLAWTPDGKSLYAAESGSSQIAEINPADGSITRRIKLGRYPHGLALVPKRKLLLATDWGLNQLSVIDLVSGALKANIRTGRQPGAVVITPDESLALVSNLLPATAATAADTATEVSVIDLNTLKAKAPIRLPLGSTNTRGLAISGDGRSAFVVHTLGRFNLPTTQLDRGWVNTTALTLIDIPANKITATVLLDQVMDGAADPWAVALDPSGLRLFVTLSGVHQLAVIDLERLPEILKTSPELLVNDLAALYRHNLIRRIDLPARGPRGLAVSPNGKLVACAGYFSGDVILSDSNGSDAFAVPLGPKAPPPLARQGEALFHDAGRCFQRWLSCASCHPDARADGLNWDLLNDGLGNPKNARSLVFSDRTPPLMSHAARSNLPACVRAGFVHILFTEPKDKELEAVTAYLKSLKPVVSPYRKPDGSLTDSALRGEKLFNDPVVACAKCHPGPVFTDLKMYDVGTSRPFDRGALSFDTTSLVELWRTSPYLHDGSAVTVRDVLLKHNSKDLHGVTSKLSPAQIDDLAAYLLSL
jgi:DNA-binding beta-propeller fold protein YncE/mono/diheme cytochrome c family protein